MAKFDIEGARSAGYSDDEIADFLGQENGFDVKGARAAGYSSAEILGELAGAKPEREKLSYEQQPQQVISQRGGKRNEVQPYVAGQAPGEAAAAQARRDFAAADPRRLDRPGQGVLDQPVLGFQPSQADLVEQSKAPATREAEARALKPLPTMSAYTPGISERASEAVAGATGSRGAGALAGRAVDTALLVPEATATGLKFGADIANLATLGAAQPVSDWLQATVQAVNQNKSTRYQQQAAELQQLMKSDQAGVVDVLQFLAANPGFASELAVPSLPSMLVGAGAGRAAGALNAAVAARRGATAAEVAGAFQTGARAGSVAGNTLMNAGDTFSETDGSVVQKLAAAGAAAAGTALTGRFLEGAEHKLAVGTKPGVRGLINTAASEDLQESAEAFSQQLGKGTAEGNFDLGQAAKQSVLEGGLGALSGGGAAAVQGRMQQLAQRDAVPQLADYEALARQKLGRAYVEPDNSISRQAGLTPIVVPGVTAPPAGSATQVPTTPGLVAGAMDPTARKPGAMPNFGAALERANEEEAAPAPAGPAKEAIDAAAAQAASSPANDLAEPTDGQKEAGNYRKGHVRFDGLNISIETPKGGTRRSKEDSPDKWEVTMPAHYGYIKGTVGSDGDHADIFIGDAGNNGRYWVINQNHAEGSGKTGHDEHKIVTGVGSAEEAVQLYKQSFANNWGDRVYSSVSTEFNGEGIKATLPMMSKPAPITRGNVETTNDNAATGSQGLVGQVGQGAGSRQAIDGRGDGLQRWSGLESRQPAGAAAIGGQAPVVGADQVQSDLRSVENERLKRGEAVKLEAIDTSADVVFSGLSKTLQAPITFIRAKTGAINFAGVAISGRIYVNANAAEAPLAVVMHEGVHTMPEDIKQALIKRVMATVTPKQREMFLVKYPSYLTRSAEKQDEELTAMLAQSEAKKPMFWRELAKKLGDGDFKKLAQHILSTLDRLLAGDSGVSNSSFTSDLKEVRAALVDAYAEVARRNGAVEAEDSMDASEYPGQFRKSLGEQVRARVETGRALAAAHDWKHSIGDVLLSSKTGRTYTIVGRSFTSQGETIRRGETTRMVPTYAVKDSDGNTNLFREDRLAADPDIKNITQPFQGDFSEERGSKETIGGYDVRSFKDGSLLVIGDPAEIRAKLPDDVLGRIVDGKGVRFPTAQAQRVRAALEERGVAYSRAGVVLDKMPMRGGKYLGAPRKFDTPAKIPTLRKHLRKLALEGEPGRFWYENSSKAILRLTGGNVQEARKFVALLAIYSPQAKVDANSTFALRAWAQYKAGMPISVKTEVMDTKARNAMADVDAFWSGEKTGNFFFNLLREIDPSTKGKQGATIDMWMMRAGQYDDDAPTSTQYAFMENETNRLAAELGWEPQQVQAAIWVAMKARMENSGVKKRTEASSEKKGWIHYKPGKNGKGKIRVIDDAQKHRDNWLAHAMAHDPTTSDTKGAKFDFEDGVLRHIGQVSFEARPGRTSGVLPGIHSAPYAQQIEFQQAVQQAFHNERGTDELASLLGLLVDSDVMAPGVWQSEVSPSTQLQVPMAPAKGKEGKTSVDPAQAKLLDMYAAVAGLVARQEGVGWHRPFYASTKREANGVDINIGRPLNPAEAADVETAVQSWMEDNGKATFVDDKGQTKPWNDAFAIVSSPKGVRLITFGIIDNETLQSDDFMGTVGMVIPDHSYDFFASSGGMATNNWETDRNGQGYKSRIEEAGRSDVLEWARAVLAPRVQAVFDDFSKRYGWGDAGSLDFSEAPAAAGARGLQEPGGVRGGARVLADARRQGAQAGRGTTLEGLPRLIPVDGRGVVEFGGYAPAQAAARAYMRQAGLPYNPPTRYAKVDVARASRIAGEFARMKHDPSDPLVQRAYQAMIAETKAQYEAILRETGLEVEFIDYAKTGDPYGNPRNAILDVVENNHLWVFSTRDGFGSDQTFDPSANPLLADTGIVISGKPALANDLFRVVHDYFGHIKEGVGFRAEGEENAWRMHSAMYSPLARRAMTSETRGQNSWVNYGPHGEANRKAGPADTVYADQKVGLLPEWVSEDGAMDFSDGANDVFKKRMSRVGIVSTDDFWKSWQNFMGGKAGRNPSLSSIGDSTPRLQQIANLVRVHKQDAARFGILGVLRQYGFDARGNRVPHGKDGFVASSIAKDIMKAAGIEPTVDNVVSSYESLEQSDSAANDGPAGKRQSPAAAWIGSEIRGRRSLLGDDPLPANDFSELPERGVENPYGGVNGQLMRQGYQQAETPTVQGARSLRTLLNKLSDGRLTSAEFELHVRMLTQRLTAASYTKQANRVMAERERGADIVREKLIRARRTGELEADTVGLALWALDQNPAMAENLGFSVRTAGDGQRSTAGMYNPASSVATLFKGQANPLTGVHEILHHTERMMPEQLQGTIRAAWSRSLNKAIDKAESARKAALVDLVFYFTGGTDAEVRRRIDQHYRDGLLRGDDYQLANPSEYWAVNASRIMNDRYLAQGARGRLKTWLREFIEKAKGLFGLDSDAPILRGLRHVLESDGSQQSRHMLQDGADAYLDINPQRAPLLAPNGKPSKLSPKQHAQVRTAEFKRWFGDWEKHANAENPEGSLWSDDEVSKAVDPETREPMVLYHGSANAGFARFYETGGNARGDLGIFLTDNPSMASSYVRRGRGKAVTLEDVNAVADDRIDTFGGVYGLFANIRRPQEQDFRGANWDGDFYGDKFEVWTADGDVFYDDAGNDVFTRDQAVEHAEEIGGTWEPASNLGMTTDMVVREARQLGSDGAIITNVMDDGGGGGYDHTPSSVIAVFDPNQVKSADFNSGDFGATDDIRFSETPAFKRWFGDSKVVDANGEPLVVYHGTTADFGKFDPEHSYDGGFHFGTPEAANKRLGYWMDGADESAQPNVMPVYLRIENPKKLSFDPYDEDSWAEQIEKAKDEGHDGIRYPNNVEGGESWVAFRPEQIKSATGNNGDFDPANPRIAFSETPWYSTLSRAVDKGPGQAMPDQWRMFIKGLTTKGVKPDEIEWSGVNEWLGMQTGKVTRDQVKAFLNANGVRVEETVLDTGRLSTAEMTELNELRDLYQRMEEGDEGAIDADEIERMTLLEEKANSNGTKYGQYTLPGGTNYREVLLTLPERRPLTAAWRQAQDQYGDDDPRTAAAKKAARAEAGPGQSEKGYKSSHWDQPNILAHIRLNDRTSADGKKVLFVEEIQSDWAQDGKKKGFASRRLEPLSPQEHSRAMGLQVRDANGERLTAEERAELESLQDRHMRSLKGTAVPDAPFVTTTDKWVALAIKRVIKMAVDGGYDQVAFVTGDQSAERYDLSKQVDDIRYGDGMLVALQNGAIMVNKEAKPEELPDLVGKEIADRLLKAPEMPGNGYRRLSGLDLKVGGEGMKAFYDKIVPAVAKDVLKKLGGGGITAAPINSDFNVFQIDEGLWGNNVNGETFGTEDQARRAASMYQPAFDITMPMREAAANGLPMFSEYDNEKDKFGRKFIGTDSKRKKITIDDLKTGTVKSDKMVAAMVRTVDDEYAIINAARKTADAVGDDWVRAVEALPGKTADRMRIEKEAVVEPLTAAIGQAAKKLGIKPASLVDAFGVYSLALHAPERNASLRAAGSKKANPSGMSEGEAKQWMDFFRSEPQLLAALQSFTPLLKRMQKRTDDIKMAAGLLSQAELDARGDWKHYVGLQGDPSMADVGGSKAGGSWNNDKDPSAKGRDSLSANPVVNTVKQLEAAVRLAEMAKVKKATYDFAVAHPDVIKAKVKRLVRRPAYDENGNFITTVPNADKFSQDAIVYRNGDVEYHIEIGDRLVLEGIKGVGAQLDLDFVSRGFGWLTRGLGRLYTQFSPHFPLVNFVRDLQQQIALIVGTTQQAANGKPINSFAAAWKIVSSYPMTMPAAVSEIMGRTPSGKWTNAARDLVAAGGTSGLVRQLDDEKALEDFVKEVRWKAGQALPSMAWHKFTGLIGAISETFELTTRVAAFEALRDAGMNTPAAAQVTKNLMNFSKAGRDTKKWANYYMFLKPSMTDVYRTSQLLRSKKGLIVFAGMYASAVAIYSMLRAMSGDDDEDKRLKNMDTRQANERRSYMILPFGGKDEPVRVPVGFGLPRLAWGLATVTVDSVKNPDFDVLDSVDGVFKSFSSTLSPMQMSDINMLKNPFAWALTSLIPSVAVPAAELGLNKTKGGNTISKAGGNFQSLPDYAIGFAGTPKEWKDAAKWVYEQTNGKWDISPENLQYLVRSYGGGPAGVILNGMNTREKQRQGEELTARDVPVAQAFVGPKDRYPERGFRELAMKLSEIKKKVNDSEERGDDFAQRLLNDPEKALIYSFKSDIESLQREESKAMKEIRQLQLHDYEAGARQLKIIEAEVRKAKQDLMNAYNAAKEKK